MDEIDNAKRLNRQLAAKCLVRVQELEARSANGEPVDTELAAARYDYEAALQELKQLDRLAGQAQVLAAKQIVADDGGDDLVQRALDNAREHIADLDAQVKLGEELAPPKPPPPANPDEAARNEFEALRTKPKKTL
jgi:hypothetical protein